VELDKLLSMAASRNASDVLIVSGAPPMLRIDGQLFGMQTPPLTPEETREMIYSILNEDEVRVFERDKELDHSYSLPSVGRFRVNVHLQRDSVAAAFRLIPHGTPRLADLGLPPIVQKLAMSHQGLLLITGPTGSGKSTTLAGIIQHINENRRAHIITVEDPIEHLFRNGKSIIEQREVGYDTLSYDQALMRVLRQDPDVIMLGEMRDRTSIAAALTAAETGHLVLATLHTSDCAQTLDRIVDVFPHEGQSQIRLQLSLSLIAVVSQQLLPRKGGGRALACEILVATPATANLIRKGETAQIKNAILTGSASGMVSMNQSIAALLAGGSIDKEVATSMQDNQIVSLGVAV